MPWIRGFVWDAENVAHIARHAVSPDEVEAALDFVEVLDLGVEEMPNSLQTWSAFSWRRLAWETAFFGYPTRSFANLSAIHILSNVSYGRLIRSAARLAAAI